MRGAAQYEGKLLGMDIVTRGRSLRELTTWGVGGRCAMFAAPVSRAGIFYAFKEAKDAGYPVFVLGGGSNVLISDEDIKAMVIHTPCCEGIEALSESGGSVLLKVKAGTSTKDLLDFSVSNALTGVEFLTGIPGTAGGAVFGNAGSAGTGFAEVLQYLDTVTFDERELRFDNASLNWCYRSCPFERSENILITEVVLLLKRSDRAEVAKMTRYFASLRSGQPIGKKTAGCVFKNPPGDSAGRLLDSCSCKGMSVGGAVISDRHANFVENTGSASALDIYTLCELCRERVFESSGVKLEYEIKFFGAFPQKKIFKGS